MNAHTKLMMYNTMPLADMHNSISLQLAAWKTIEC